ncbi:MAG TPA: hypothetical protein VNR60_04010 [Croceibacterium sp.]|nr:hypothetical protein [Croceibacterium sp.]
MSNNERRDWTQEGAFFASDGASVRAYDDVFLIEPVAVRDQGKGGPWETVPSGSQATVLFFTADHPAELDLECYVEDGFCFAQTTAANVRFAIRNEEKYPR